MAMYYGDENGKAQEVVVVGMQGPAGPQGPQGATGPQGPAGQGVPAGGTAGQVLAKADNSDYNARWVNQANGEWELVHTGEHFNFFEKDGLVAIVTNSAINIPSGATVAQNSVPYGGYVQVYDDSFETNIPSGLVTSMPDIIASLSASDIAMSQLVFAEFLGSILMRYSYFAPPGGSAPAYISPGTCLCVYKK